MPIVIVILVVGIALVLISAVVRAKRARARAEPPPPPPDDRADPHPDERTPAPPSFGAPVPRFRVVALGPSGSGKSVLISSMFHELSYFSGGRSYFLDTNPQDRLLLDNVYEEVSDTSRPWPRATGRSLEETKEYTFRCVGRDIDGRHHTVAEISYLDFAGVLLEDAANAASASFAKVYEAISNASGLLVLIDGRRVRQLLEGDPEGYRHFAHTLNSTLGLAQNATCPLHLVVTKWDLIQDYGPLREADEAIRLDAVVQALMRHPRISALVGMHDQGSRVRLIPVSSVGRGFVEIGDQGLQLKRAEATVRPTNIDAPLAAVVPDFFKRVEVALDADTRRSVNAELRQRMRLGAGEFVSAFAIMLGRPAGVVLRSVLGGFVGRDFGDGAYSLFLDYIGRDFMAKGDAVRNFRNETERQIALVREVRARVLQDFDRSVHRLEDTYPHSLLSGASWAA